MTKEEAVLKYQEEYLKDKPEDRRQEFYSKPLQTRYSAIMAWKRRHELRQNKPVGLSSSDVVRHAQSLATMIETAENFSDKEMEKLHSAVDAAKEMLNNYHKIRRGRELRALEREREELQRRIDLLKSEGII